MTWPWEDVREEACRYYGEGKSLTEVKRLIKRKRPTFNPSDRAFRTKFDEWGVKRPRKTKADEATSDVTKSAHIAVADLPAAVATSAPGQPYDPSSRIVHKRLSLSHACSCGGNDTEFLAHHIFNYADVRDFQLSLPSMPQGIDNVIHLLVRDLRWTKVKEYNSVLSGLLSFAEDSRIVDGVDCQGMTALEIAIRVENVHAMEILIDRGALLQRNEGLAPLDIALHHSSNIRLLAELLRRTKAADILSDVLDNPSGDHSVRKEICDTLPLNAEITSNIDAIVSSSKDDMELRDAYFVTQCLILHNEADRVPMTRTLLENWHHRDLLHSVIGHEEWALKCLRRLLKGGDDVYGFGWSPWKRENKRTAGTYRYWGRTCPPSCTCPSAAAFALFHVGGQKIVDAFIAALDLAESDRLLPSPVSTAMNPCPARATACDSGALCRILKSVMKKWREKKNIIARTRDADRKTEEALKEILRSSPVDLKSAFWETVAPSPAFSLLAWDNAADCSVVDHFTKIPEPIAWDLLNE